MWYKFDFKSFRSCFSSSDRKLYIMRGLPGGGKSFKAKALGADGQILSTDDYYMKDGKYCFDSSKLPEAHKWNIDRAKQAMEQGISPVVVDNTNTKAWEAKPYVQHGLKHGYNVEIAEADTPWAFDVPELARRNQHGVPENIIQQLSDEWEPNLTVDDILQSTAPYEKKIKVNAE